MEKRIKIQVIGSYLENLNTALKNMGIIVESCIPFCSPLSMVGDTDPKYISKFASNAEVNMSDLLSLKKNLANMLSRSPDNFSQNINKQPVGQEVRIKNTSDYLVFMNSASVIPLYKKGTVVFSSMRSGDINGALKNDKEYYLLNAPFSGDFNWKFYYDKFIETILNEYDSKHIVLIKTNSAQWFIDNREIKAFGNRSSLFRNMINEMDEYFIERTKCCVINEHFNNIPPNSASCFFPYAIMGKNAQKTLASEIKKVIVSDAKEEYAPLLPKYGNDFMRFLHRKLSSEIIEKNKKDISVIADNWLTLKEVKEQNSEDKCAFFADLTKLSRFLEHTHEYTLSDYVIELLNKSETSISSDDIALTELYTKYLKLDINDIIAVYMLSERFENKSEFKIIVDNILNNKDCYPACAAKRFRSDNVSFLKDYPYLSVKNFPDNSDDVYVRLENNCHIVLNSDSETPIRKFYFDVPDKFDFYKVISNGYICSIENADALTYSYDYYIEKARNGDGSKPTYLRFETDNAFFESLNYFDYPSLLENERFAFTIENESVDLSDGYNPVVDLTEMLDPNLVTVKIMAGLGDQIGYYTLGQLIEKYSNRKVIYEDVFCGDFNGLEVNKYTKKPMRLLSDIFSNRLFFESKNNRTTFFRDFYRKINSRYLYFTFDYNYKYKHFADGSDCFMTPDIKTAVTTVLPYSHYAYWISIDKAKASFEFNLNEYIEFPMFEKKEHIILSEKMLSCDSVVIHVRLGDYITFGWQTENEYYIEMIGKIMKLTQYPNKKFFVFSDDIKWCKENHDKLGLNNVGDCEVIYVEGNKYDESFRDIQLMALGKIMIIGSSYFPRIAALYSNRWEMFFSSDKGKCDLFEKYVRKNKYDITEIPEKEENI